MPEMYRSWIMIISALYSLFAENAGLAGTHRSIRQRIPIVGEERLQGAASLVGSQNAIFLSMANQNTGRASNGLGDEI